MRGEDEKQLGLLSVINLEARVRKDHPLRRIKPWADRALGKLSPVFAGMYSGIGRPSVPATSCLTRAVDVGQLTFAMERRY